MDIERVLMRVDRIAGGRQAGRRVALPFEPRVRRAFRAATWLLIGCLALGLGSVAAASVLTATGSEVSPAVWMRCLVVLGITATLFYFLWRAQLGWYWALRRLQLFSRIFPVVALSLAAIPGLYPLWVIGEQILFAVLLIGVSDYLHGDAVRRAFPKPSAEPAAAEPAIVEPAAR